MKNHIYAVYYRVLSVSTVEELLRFFRAHAEILSEDRNFLIIVSKDSADRLRDSVLQFLDSCEALLILEAGRSFASARWPEEYYPLLQRHLIEEGAVTT